MQVLLGQRSVTSLSERNKGEGPIPRRRRVARRRLPSDVPTHQDGTSVSETYEELSPTHYFKSHTQHEAGSHTPHADECHTHHEDESSTHPEVTLAVTPHPWEIAMDIIHPTQTRFPCLICNTWFPILSSLTRHFTKSHPEYTLAMRFCYAMCDYTHPSKRSIGCHFRSHGVAAAPIHVAVADDFVCPHCVVHLPSKNSCSQHIRAQHMVEACAARAAKADDGRRRLWDAIEIQSFEDAVRRVGPDSNIKIAAIVGTHSAKQVGVFKRRYFSDYPEWLKNNFRPSSSPPLSCSVSLDISSPSNISLHAESTDVSSKFRQLNVSLHMESTDISSPSNMIIIRMEPSPPTAISYPSRQENVISPTEPTPPGFPLPSLESILPLRATLSPAATATIPAPVSPTLLSPPLPFMPSPHHVPPNAYYSSTRSVVPSTPTWGPR